MDKSYEFDLVTFRALNILFDQHSYVSWNNEYSDTLKVRFIIGFYVVRHDTSISFNYQLRYFLIIHALNYDEFVEQKEFRVIQTLL